MNFAFIRRHHYLLPLLGKEGARVVDNRRGWGGSFSVSFSGFEETEVFAFCKVKALWGCLRMVFHGMQTGLQTREEREQTHPRSGCFTECCFRGFLLCLMNENRNYKRNMWIFL